MGCKMNRKISIVDHTVNEVLRLGYYNPDDIHLMLSILKKYALDFVDISLHHVEKSGGIFEADDLCNRIRCIVNCSEREIVLAKELGFSNIIINCSLGSNISIYSILESALKKACDSGHTIYLCIDNAIEFATEVTGKLSPLVVKYGVERLIIGDIDGNSDPFTTYDRLRDLLKSEQCPIEYLGGNEYGMATANTLSALKAGVEYVATSVSGIGVPGMAPMEEVLMAARHLWKNQLVPDGSNLAIDCKTILSKAGILLPDEKAVIGSRVFAHESGIHVDGILKNPELYEIMKPEEVGLSRYLVIGKHSGTASLMYKFRQMNFSLSQDNATELLKMVRNVAISQKKPVTDLQLELIYSLQMELVGYKEL
jgi:homocitrate synthase NifV